MSYLLTGATGYIGSAILRELRDRGEDVVAVVRSADAALRVEEYGATAALGDLTDRAWLADQLREVDAAIHTAAGADGHDDERNEAVIDAVVEAFGGTDKPYVHTGGIWTYGSAADITEESPANPVALTAWRVPQEDRLLESPVRATVLQPGLVYGHGAGIVAMVIGDGGPTDELPLVGDGSQHWTTVHVDDLADLYLLAVGHEGRVIGATGHNPTVREVLEATGRPVVETSVEQVHERLGEAFGDALLLDQQATGDLARSLGWEPSRPDVLTEVASASKG